MKTATPSIDDYIAARKGPIADLLQTLRQFVAETLTDCTEGMKWGAPVFFNAHGEPVIYLYGGRDHANIGFIRGAELKDPEGVLEGSGKSGRHVKVYPGEQIWPRSLAALIKQCAAL